MRSRHFLLFSAKSWLCQSWLCQDQAKSWLCQFDNTSYAAFFSEIAVGRAAQDAALSSLFKGVEETIETAVAAVPEWDQASLRAGAWKSWKDALFDPGADEEALSKYVAQGKGFGGGAPGGGAGGAGGARGSGSSRPDDDGFGSKRQRRSGSAGGGTGGGTSSSGGGGGRNGGGGRVLTDGGGSGGASSGGARTKSASIVPYSALIVGKSLGVQDTTTACFFGGTVGHFKVECPKSLRPYRASMLLAHASRRPGLTPRRRLQRIDSGWHS
jgi:hypothetical protein